MELPINHDEPLVMHIDLNSCFATCEQQAYPRLRGKPFVVAAYDTPRGIILSPSIEAKKLGMKLGMTVSEARFICPSVIVKMPDPPKYRAIYTKFNKIFREYSPDVVPKSIDEAVINFAPVESIRRKSLTDIGKEIKRRMKEEIGEWIRCNVGIGPNRFLAKTAASLHKPDGLDIITHETLENTYKKLSLIDLCGINVRYQAKLQAAGILTPLQFLHASLQKLQKEVFQSIAGYYWFLRLRGWEIDDVGFERRSFGHTYALGKKTDNPWELKRLLMKLTEKMARRLRKAGMIARGVHVSVAYNDKTFWHKGMTFDAHLYTTQELFRKVIYLFTQQPEQKIVTNLSVSCFNLSEKHGVQETLFDTDHERRQRVSDACDQINNTYGEFVITPALMMEMDNLILDRIAFGNVKEIENLYTNTNI